MPNFDFNAVYCGSYENHEGTVSYNNFQEMGAAMTANLNISTAEGRVYAKGALSEFKKLVTGGSISIGVKYIPDAVQKMLFGSRDKTRSVSSKPIKSLVTGSKDIAKYVGVGMYSADVIDGVDKYTALFVHKALFGAPSYTFETKGQNLTFQTPTTTGEFMPSDITDQDILEVATVETEAEALAWIKACFGVSA